MNETIMLNSSLLDKIASKHDAVDVVRMFHELHGSIAGSDFCNFYKMFLSSATEHNHSELRIILLADIVCDKHLTQFPDDEMKFGSTLVLNSDYSDQSEILDLIISGKLEHSREG